VQQSRFAHSRGSHKRDKAVSLLDAVCQRVEGGAVRSAEE
jgi:hypothetical protein